MLLLDYYERRRRRKRRIPWISWNSFSSLSGVLRQKKKRERWGGLVMMMMMRYGSMYVFVIRLQVSWDDDLGVFVRLCMYFGVCGGGVRSII